MEPNLPPRLVEAIGDRINQASAMPRTAECVPCLAGDPPEGGMLINSPAIQACTGLSKRSVAFALNTMESANIIDRYRPSRAARLAGAKPVTAQTFCFRLTELGKQVLPPEPRENCKLRNPLVGRTANDDKINHRNPDEADQEAADTGIFSEAEDSVKREASEPPVDPDQIPVIFEKMRGKLRAIATSTLAGAGLDPLLRDDVISEAAIVIYERFVLADNPIGENHLRHTLPILVRRRALDLIRREANVGKAERRTLYGQPMRTGMTSSLVESEALRNAYSEQLITIMAGMFLKMTDGQRDAILDVYRQDIGGDVTQTSVPIGTLKTRRFHARKKAVGAVAASLLSGQVLAAGDVADLTPKQAVETVLAENDLMDIGSYLSSFAKDSPEVMDMKRLIRSVLYPNDTALDEPHVSGDT